MFRLIDRSVFWRISSVLLALLISACNAPVNVPINTPVEAPTIPVVADAPSVTVDVSGVAQDFTSQVVAAVDPGSDGPGWGVMPQHTLLMLQDYPTPDHLLKAQIFVFPIDGLRANETTNVVLESLVALLQSQQAVNSMPYLPLYNAAQVMHTQVKHLVFKSGRGVRYLTQFDQAPLPINNYELHYTFQGLTSDGEYYVAAVLPVNQFDLPADASVDLDNSPANFMEDFPAYLSDTVNMLNGQPASAFTPDLSALDAMMESLEIK